MVTIFCKVDNRLLTIEVSPELADRFRNFRSREDLTTSQLLRKIHRFSGELNEKVISGFLAANGC